ncbi:phosphatase PAP2 family protein [Streptomyces sp. NBC_01803]|uniref:phosphatase PAP2 family protein n=1 Tax=Streptomyces sp. NBC_01803 TaxID=2975946 RepID=UPI002DD9D55B|nr:phosphatase PAP2 family protein [Streptomyces sp. NBC_01803]WSA45088.1 phosphatase PAP2 family protein [Streptomyces sp. NBC_01803]
MPPRRYLAASAAAILLAVLVAVVTLRGDSPFGVDTAAHDWALEHRTPGWVDVFTVITDSGSRGLPHLLAALAGALAAPRRWWLGALAGLGALVLAQWLRYALVTAVDRARPPAEDWTRHVNGDALPSGHATTSALTAIGLAAALLPYCHRTVTRALAIGVPAVWAVAVGVSRVYLGVHWPTDIVGGWLFATALCCAFLPPLARALGRTRE